MLSIRAERSAEESIAPITAEELSVQVGARRELGQRVVLRLLLQRLALLQPVADVGDDVAHTRIRVITGKKGS